VIFVALAVVVFYGCIAMYALALLRAASKEPR